MAQNPFDRVIFQVRERPLSSDWDQVGSQADLSLRWLAQSLFSDSSANKTGFLSDGFKVTPASGFSVSVTKGLGFAQTLATQAAIDGIIGLDDLSQYGPMSLSQSVTFTVPAAPSAGNSRIDIIECRIDRRTENPLSRDVFNTTTGVFTPNSINKTLAWDLFGRTGQVNSTDNSTAGLSYKIGATAATDSQVAPSTTSGYVKIAEIHVSDSTTSVDQTNIADTRPLLFAGGTATVGISFKAKNDVTMVPTALTARGPNGCPVFVLQNNGIPNLVSVYIIGNFVGGAYSVSPIVSAGNAVMVSSSTTAMSLTTLDPATAALLNSVLAVAYPTGTKVSAGQPALFCPVGLLAQDGSSKLFATAPSDPTNLTFSITVW